MNNLFKQVGIMFNQQLYSNVVLVCELTLGSFDQKPDFSPVMKCQMLIHYADSLFNLNEYIRAEAVYRQLLQFKKYIMKSKNSPKLPDLQNEMLSDAEIKYKIYLCCIKQKKGQDAFNILLSVQSRLKTAKINMALGNLYLENGMERSAVAAFREVLRENPFAVEAAEKLLKLGVQGADVNSLMLETINDVMFLNVWLRGQAEMYLRDYKTAVATFKSLDTPGLLINNPVLMVSIAYCYTYMCKENKAITYLQTALHADPNLKYGRDLLSTLLAKSNDKHSHAQLEKLLTPNVDMSLWTSHQWVVLGNYMYVKEKYDKAVYFGHHACMIEDNGHNIEATLLKANALLKLGKAQEAASHCVEAQVHCPYRFDIYKCVVDCYIKLNRLQEAESVASNACKQLNNCAPALTLHASVMAKVPLNSAKVIRLLQKAVTADLGYAPAVFLLAEQFDQEQRYDEARELLLRHASVNPSSRVHQMIGDYYAKLVEDTEAFNHYCIALKLDPTNQRATEGLNSLGRTVSSAKRDSSYYTSAGESSSYLSQPPTNADHDQDADSDMDTWPRLITDCLTYE